jgi:hypothetical protein
MKPGFEEWKSDVERTLVQLQHLTATAAERGYSGLAGLLSAQDHIKDAVSDAQETIRENPCPSVAKESP